MLPVSQAPSICTGGASSSHHKKFENSLSTEEEDLVPAMGSSLFCLYVFVHIIIHFGVLGFNISLNEFYYSYLQKMKLIVKKRNLHFFVACW